MQLNTVIFDMDGLLIDSEPLWNEAAIAILARHGIVLTEKQYETTTGIRTKEFINYWFTYFKKPLEGKEKIEHDIVEKVIELVIQKGKPMPGLAHIFNFFIDRKFKIGLASSSAPKLIDVVVDRLQIRAHLNAIASADMLEHGKPHPEVYLNCAQQLQSTPAECLCFEDSFPGMIAAKAAKMKCVVVPDHKISKELKWHAADLRISSLQNFNELLLQSL